MDLDLGQVRAFVTASDTRSFSRAAEQLHLSQQALSKRIGRLEVTVGALFVRNPGGVTLTARGVRFLPAARELLAAAEAAEAVAAGTSTTVLLRVDVWGHLHPPHVLVQGFAAAHPDLVVQISMRRSLPQAMTALERREIDAALGNVSGLGRPLPAGLIGELVTTTPLAALLNSRHPLAARPHLAPEDLRDGGLWWPTEPGSLELDRFAVDYARTVGVHLATDGRNLGLEALLDEVRADPGRITVVSEQWPIPPDPSLRVVPLRPAPHYPWYVVSPAAAAHPAVASLRHHLRVQGYVPRISDAVWLPSAMALGGAGGPT